MTARADGRIRSTKHVDGRLHRTARRVAHDHGQPGGERVGRKLDAANDRRRHHVARNTDHEQVGDALVEDHLGTRESEQLKMAANGRCPAACAAR
jgi:hypothetical protein